MWHKELYKIYKRGKTFGNSSHNRGFRLFTKIYLAYVVAGGTSIHVFIDQGSYRIVSRKNIDYLQISSSWYLNNKDTFDQCLTYNDEIKLMQKETKTDPLDSFLEFADNGETAHDSGTTRIRYNPLTGEIEPEKLL